MSKFIMRVLLACLALTVLARVTTSIYTPIAQAQSLAHVHILHLPQWYAQQTPLLDIPTASNNLKYYGGQVMAGGSATYAIFWVPSGFSVEPNYASLIGRYLNDIGGSAFFKIVTQYYENPGKQHILNHSTLGGSVVDTAPYPGGRGTATNPLTDADIQAQVSRVAAAQGWSGGTSNLFFVFTAQGVESCIDASTCTPGTAQPAFCAYHGYFVSNGTPYLYANMPYAASWGASCGAFSKSPNHDSVADTEISITSHEHFEAVTDLNPPPLGPIPGTTAWTDKSGFEIGDKCAYKFGAIAADGHNLKLNGHPYIAQLEWSNKRKGCAKK